MVAQAGQVYDNRAFESAAGYGYRSYPIKPLGKPYQETSGRRWDAEEYIPKEIDRETASCRQRSSWPRDSAEELALQRRSSAPADMIARRPSSSRRENFCGTDAPPSRPLLDFGEEAADWQPSTRNARRAVDLEADRKANWEDPSDEAAYRQQNRNSMLAFDRKVDRQVATYRRDAPCQDTLAERRSSGTEGMARRPSSSQPRDLQEDPRETAACRRRSSSRGRDCGDCPDCGETRVQRRPSAGLDTSARRPSSSQRPKVSDAQESEEVWYKLTPAEQRVVDEWRVAQEQRRLGEQDALFSFDSYFKGGDGAAIKKHQATPFPDHVTDPNFRFPRSERNYALVGRVGSD